VGRASYSTKAGDDGRGPVYDRRRRGGYFPPCLPASHRHRNDAVVLVSAPPRARRSGGSTVRGVNHEERSRLFEGPRNEHPGIAEPLGDTQGEPLRGHAVDANARVGATPATYYARRADR
jgi:hypothetical protein